MLQYVIRLSFIQAILKEILEFAVTKKFNCSGIYRVRDIKKMTGINYIVYCEENVIRKIKLLTEN